MNLGLVKTFPLRGTYIIERFDKDFDMWQVLSIQDLNLVVKLDRPALLSPIYQSFPLTEIRIIKHTREESEIFLLDSHYKYRLHLFDRKQRDL